MPQIYLVESACWLGAASSSTNTIGAGLKTFVIGAGDPTPLWGMTLRAEHAASSANYVEGPVVEVSGLSVTINATTTGGSGSSSSWVLTDGTVRFTTGNGYNDPSAPGWYEPCVQSLGRGSASIFGDGRTFGVASIGAGWIKLGNAGGVRDSLRRYGFYGRQTRILVGDSANAYSSFSPFVTGTVEQAIVSKSDVLLRFRDRLSELRKPLIAERYAGSNVKPYGLEGEEDDLKGRFKPLLRGYARNFAPIMVNMPKLIYQISAKAINGIGWVKDGGLNLAVGAQRSSLSDLQGVTTAFTASGTIITATSHGIPTGSAASMYSTGTMPLGLTQYSIYYVRSTGVNTLTLHASASDASSNINPIAATGAGSGIHYIWSMPTPGAFDYYLGSASEGAYIRLGSRPGKSVTIEAWEGATAADRYAANIWKRVLLTDAGYTMDDIVQADIDAVNAASPYETGFWVVGGGSEEDVAQPTAPDEWGAVQGAVAIKDALDVLIPGIRGWYAADLDGKFRLGQVSVPSAAPVATFIRYSTSNAAALDEFDIADMELLASGDSARGVPLARVNVKYAPNYTVQSDGDLLGDKESATDPVGGLVVREVLRRQYKMTSHPASGQDADVLLKWKIGLENTWVTALRYAADATTLATDLFGIYGDQRDRVRLLTRIKPDMLPATQLGATVKVVAPRYGCDFGKKFIVMGRDYDMESGIITLDLGLGTT